MLLRKRKKTGKLGHVLVLTYIQIQYEATLPKEEKSEIFMTALA